MDHAENDISSHDGGDGPETTNAPLGVTSQPAGITLGALPQHKHDVEPEAGQLHSVESHDQTKPASGATTKQSVGSEDSREQPLSGVGRSEGTKALRSRTHRAWAVVGGISIVMTILGIQVFNVTLFPVPSGTEEPSPSAGISRTAPQRVAFNEWTTNPEYGDERNFAKIALYEEEASIDDIQWMDEIRVSPGGRYILRVLVNNNAIDLDSLVAIDTRVVIANSASLDSEEGQQQASLRATVSASNGDPAAVTDSVTLLSDKQFRLELVEGTARFTTASLTSEDRRGVTVSDDLTRDGALVGFSALDGRLPGGWEHAGFLTVIISPRFEAQTPTGWGPGREMFSVIDRSPSVTLNSIYDNPTHGDERNFALVRKSSNGSAMYSDHVELEPGQEYEVLAYFSNGALETADGSMAALGVTMSSRLPAVVDDGGEAKASVLLMSSNAIPAQVWDSFVLSNNSGGAMALRFVPKSATIHSAGGVDGARLSEEIWTEDGAVLGFDRLDGILPADAPGRTSFGGFVTYRFVADQPNFSVDTLARQSPEEEWVKDPLGEEGQTVWCLIRYRNTGSTKQTNVVFRSELPLGVSFVVGSARYSDGRGIRVAADDLTTNGLNMGSFDPGADASVWFAARIPHGWVEANGTTELEIAGIVETNNGGKRDQVVVRLSSS